MLKAVMRTIVVREFGGPEPECMKLVHGHPVPDIGPGQVLVRVHVAGVNPVDCYVRSGRYAILPQLPYTPGKDGAGTVEKLSEAESGGLRVGDRCWFGCGQPVTGSYAQFALVQRTQVFQLPENASFAQGASLGTAYGTAHRALFNKARLREMLSEKKGPVKVFVHGISGGVGLAACQMARASGAQVYGTAGTPDGIRRCMEMPNGPLKVWSHRDQNYIADILAEHPQGFDLVLEMLANKNLSVDLSHLAAPQGTVMVIGNRGTIDGFDPRTIMAKELIVRGVALGKSTDEEINQIGTDLNAMLSRGDIMPQIGRQLGLAQVADAHRAMLEPMPAGEGAANTFGKVVIDIDRDE